MEYAAGNIVYVSNDQDVVHYGNPSKIKWEKKSTVQEAVGFGLDVGPVQVLDSVVTRVDWEVTVTQETVNGLDYELMLDQRETTLSTVVIPGPESVLKVPSTAPYEVAIPGIAVDTKFFATVVSDTAPMYLEQVTGATAISAGKFKVTSGKVTFDVSQAGKTLVSYYLTEVTALKSIGGPAPANSYGKLALFMIVQGTRTKKKFWFPSIVSDGNLSGGVGDKPEKEMKFKVTTPAGFNHPYMVWNAA